MSLEVVCAMIGSLQIVLVGTPMHDPAIGVTPTNVGPLLHGKVELPMTATNCRGTLLRGVESKGEAKSSSCNAIKYTPGLVVAKCSTSHCEMNAYYVMYMWK